MLTSVGELVSAEVLKATDTLLSPEGEEIQITDLQQYTGRMAPYNVMVNKYDTSPLAHIVFAEGMAIGYISFQDGLDSYMSRAALRN